jgi:lipopolysaccharide/colanic/teichoic acid biosynthesis glycosyltransferase
LKTIPNLAEIDTPTSVNAGIECPVWSLAIKRLFDIVLALIAILVLAPVLLAAAIAVKISSPGPVFYRGIRAGLFGRPFRIFKFRTMLDNAESLGGPTTGTNDRRVTKIGAWFRRTKIDELPQLFNVLVGDMSFVGPRPEVQVYASQYVGEEKCILNMRPGITDYASIEFVNLDDIVGNKDPDAYFKENILPRKNELRVQYVKKWSLRSDFKILWLTGCRILRRIICN